MLPADVKAGHGPGSIPMRFFNVAIFVGAASTLFVWPAVAQPILPQPTQPSVPSTPLVPTPPPPQPGGNPGSPFPNSPAPAPAPAPTPGTPLGGQTGSQITEITPAQVVTLLDSLNFQSQVSTSNNEIVVTNFWGQGVVSGVLLQGTCDAGGCTTLSFFADLGKVNNIDQNWVNAWNGEKGYVRAFLGSDQSLFFEYDLPLLTGVSTDYIKATAAGFKSVVDTASTFKPGSQ